MVDGLKVLLVDDDPVTLAVLEAALSDAGHTVLTRQRSLGTAMELYRESPDVVVLDVHMPALSGDELVKVLTSDRRFQDTAFILHSSTVPERVEELAAGCGAIGGIRKGGNVDEYLQDFDRLLEVWRRRRAGGAR